MPIPKPNANETESNFMARCMDNTTMLAEYPDSDQRVAVCLSSYNDKKEIQVTEEFETSSIDIKAEIKAYEEDEKGYFSGYGSIFGNKDLGNDVMVEGAFAKSIASKGAKGVKLLYQHKADEPIGVFEEIIEDPKGLKVKGRLAMGTQRGREVYELMKMGALDSMSIGYKLSPEDYKYSDKLKKRTITNLDLMEVSMVTFPMNPKAKITKVKLAEMNVRELEHYLRDAGMSGSVAKQSANILYKSFNPELNEQRDVVDSIKHLINLIKD